MSKRHTYTYVNKKIPKHQLDFTPSLRSELLSAVNLWGRELFPLFAYAKTFCQEQRLSICFHGSWGSGAGKFYCSAAVSSGSRGARDVPAIFIILQCSRKVPSLCVTVPVIYYNQTECNGITSCTKQKTGIFTSFPDVYKHPHNSIFQEINILKNTQFYVDNRCVLL